MDPIELAYLLILFLGALNRIIDLFDTLIGVVGKHLEFHDVGSIRRVEFEYVDLVKLSLLGLRGSNLS